MNPQKPIFPDGYAPSSALVRAAAYLCLAREHEAHVRPVVHGYENAILAQHQFRVSRRLISLGVPDEPIRDTTLAYRMESADREVFLAALPEARIASGLQLERSDSCPLIAAEIARVEAENALLKALEEMPGNPKLASRILPQEKRESILSLALQLMIPFIHSGASDLDESSAASPELHRH